MVTQNAPLQAFHTKYLIDMIKCMHFVSRVFSENFNCFSETHENANNYYIGENVFAPSFHVNI